MISFSFEELDTCLGELAEGPVQRERAKSFVRRMAKQAASLDRLELLRMVLVTGYLAQLKDPDEEAWEIAQARAHSPPH